MPDITSNDSSPKRKLGSCICANDNMVYLPLAGEVAVRRGSIKAFRKLKTTGSLLNSSLSPKGNKSRDAKI